MSPTAQAAEFNNGGASLASWNTGQVTSLRETFRDADAFLGLGLASWDVSKVTTLEGTFECSPGNFVEDISEWKTGAVTSLEDTFSGQQSFNAPIGKWDTSNVVNMYGTFQGVSRHIYNFSNLRPICDCCPPLPFND